MRLPIPFLHIWRRGTWGVASNLDCRECRVCGRFEIWAYGRFDGRNRDGFPDAIFPVAEREAE